MIFNAEKRSSIRKEREEEIVRGLGSQETLLKMKASQDNRVVYFLEKRAGVNESFSPLLK